MTLYIYRLEGCKICTQRQSKHNELDKYMSDNGVEVVGILFGMVNGERIIPLPQHDDLCRKEDDHMKYQAPVYILETGDTVVKLPDIGSYSTIKEYCDTVLNILDDIEESTPEE